MTNCRNVVLPTRLTTLFSAGCQWPASPHLHEIDDAPIVIHYRLIARRIPPFGREIVLASRHNDGERVGQVKSCDRPLPFFVREKYFTAETGDGDRYAEPLFEELRIPMQEMVRTLFASDGSMDNACR